MRWWDSCWLRGDVKGMSCGEIFYRDAQALNKEQL